MAHIEGQIRTDEGVSTAVYTDGSKNNQGNTLCSFYVPSHDLRRSYRMTDGSSALAAEMEAIGRAIEWATTANIPHVVVFSDSLGSVDSLENQRSGSRPRQLMDLMYALDDYAVRTKSSPSSGYLVTWGYRAMRLRTTYASVHSITTQWTSRRRWSTARLEPSTATSSSGSGRRSGPPPDTGSQYRALEPTVSRARKFADPNRRKEVAINRLRLGHTCFISGADTLPETVTGVAFRKPSATSFWSALPRWAPGRPRPGHAHVTTGLSTCAPHSVSPVA